MYDFIEEYFSQVIIGILCLCIGIILIWSQNTIVKNTDLSWSGITNNLQNSVTWTFTNIQTGVFVATIKNEEPVLNTIKNLSNEDTIPKGKYYIVERVIDWDTVDVWLDANVRVLGMDSPESSTTRYGHTECDGKQATEYTKKILLRKKIILEKDTIQPETDRYQRYLAHIWIDGELFSEKIINAGYAVKYTKAETKYSDILIKAEINAKNNQIWLWWDCK